MEKFVFTGQNAELEYVPIPEVFPNGEYKAGPDYSTIQLLDPVVEVTPQPTDSKMENSATVNKFLIFSLDRLEGKLNKDFLHFL